MKKLKFFIGAIALCLVLASCSQEEQEDSNVSEQKTETVSELTSRLKAYDKQFMTGDKSSERIKILGYKFSLRECLKIGIADVKGGISGFKQGGVPMAIVGAGVASALKFIELLDKKKAKQEKVNPQNALLKSNGLMNFNDSIGFYHIAAEKHLYENMGNGIKSISSMELLCHIHSMMNNSSDGYRVSNSFNSSSLSAVTNDVEKIRRIQDYADAPYADYYEKVRGLDVADGDYLDFASEYLYTVLMGNVGDVKSYTNSVISQISKSNASGDDKKILTQSIYIAFSSVMYSTSVEIQE
ncbi:hypothetical protein [Prevotella pectinovora]|uniref:hypothetical protein n=1 Tax=Prevotella pectinovora TaxID=1602169 RepID=UPI002430541D|nr:hypothetical protein [Prevotella pectinovora]MCI6048235.1 hypothetical protein [Prevotella pectinovora]MDD6863616.1 hypothetical protein [Prevotella sp.]